MTRRSLWVTGFILAVVSAGTASAQFEVRGPQMRGVWNPVVGSGAAYQVESKGEPKRQMEFAIVGTETVQGKPGHWMEMFMKDPEEGDMVLKQLFVLADEQVEMQRFIIQKGDEPPIEFSMSMMRAGRGGKQSAPADSRQDAELVGTETVTTPAGTFTCQHYRAKDKSADFWIAEKVPPYGLVKMTSRESNMTLLRLVTNAKTRIRGTPQKLDLDEMMRRQPRP